MPHLHVHVLAVALASAVVSAGDSVVVRAVGPAPRQPLTVYLSSSVGALRPVGTLRRGGRTLRFRLPRLAADVYAPAFKLGDNVLVGRGRLSVRALPPAGFGALGAPGCAPASPIVGTDIFGTAAGAQLWALPFGSGTVGQETKIVFRMTSGVPTVFYAVAPNGRRVAPVWGPTAHIDSTWTRPGREWGAGFVFDVAGCWQIHAGAFPAQGDVWLVVRS